jgi:hypothetical protein
VVAVSESSGSRLAAHREYADEHFATCGETVRRPCVAVAFIAPLFISLAALAMLVSWASLRTPVARTENHG